MSKELEALKDDLKLLKPYNGLALNDDKTHAYSRLMDYLYASTKALESISNDEVKEAIEKIETKTEFTVGYLHPEFGADTFEVEIDMNDEFSEELNAITSYISQLESKVREFKNVIDRDIVVLETVIKYDISRLVKKYIEIRIKELNILKASDK